MPKLDITKSKPYLYIVAFVAILPAVTYFGIPLPKVAWAQDILQLEEEQLETAIDLYRRELSRQKYENLKLQREIERQDTISDSYLKEQEYLESDIEEIRQRIEEASKRLVEIN